MNNIPDHGRHNGQSNQFLRILDQINSNRFTRILGTILFLTVVGGIMRFLLNFLPVFDALLIVYLMLLGGTVVLLGWFGGMPLVKGLPLRWWLFFILGYAALVILVYSWILKNLHNTDADYWYWIGIALILLLALAFGVSYIVDKY